MQLPQWPGKQGCWIFLLKIYFQSIFAPNTSKKHFRNFGKPICNLQKPTSKPKIKKNSWAQICFLGTSRLKKTPNLNSPHHVRPFDTKTNRFGGRNRHNNNFLSLG
jgi:hypothetical protein